MQFQNVHGFRFTQCKFNTWQCLVKLICTCSMTCALVAVACLFRSAFLDVKYIRNSSMWVRGLITPDPNSVFTSTSQAGSSSSGAFLKQIILINSPQLLFSTMYVAYNGALTMMHVSQEWSNFAFQRKALRVSSPKRGQRSSYWLNLPWSYSLPLLATSALLHWMVSRSLYLVNIYVYGPYQTYVESESMLSCGFSTIFLLMLFLLLTIIVFVLLGISFKTLNGDIPLVGSNSLAISSACHDPGTEEEETCKELMRGVTEPAFPGWPRHCAFSSLNVDTPVPGQQYR